MASKKLLWTFLKDHLINGTYGDKLAKVQETEDGFIFEIEAMSQKNSLMEGKKEEHLRIFADYNLFKGRKKPRTTQEYTKSRLALLNSIVKCRCIPCGKIYKMPRKKVKERGIAVKEHFQYFMYSRKLIVNKVRDNVENDELPQTSQSAPASPMEFTDNSSDIKVNNEGGNHFPFEPGEATNLPQSSISPAVKKRAHSVDVLQEICKYLEIPDFQPANTLNNTRSDCRNSHSVMSEIDMNTNYANTTWLKEEIQECDAPMESSVTDQMYSGIALNSVYNHALQAPPLESLVAEDGPMQLTDPDQFINFEDTKKNEELDLPCLYDIDSNFDLDIEGLDIEIPRSIV